MKLYSVDLSPFAARVRTAIYARGLDIEIIAPPAEGTKSPEYLALNPLGRVPVLVLDNGTSLPESETIVEYLEDAVAKSPLRPASPETSARARLVARVAELYLWPHVAALFPQIDPKTRNQVVVDEAVGKIGEGLTHVNVFLGDGPFAVGEAFSTADCWLIPVLFFVGVAGPMFGAGDLLAPHAKLSAYARALADHPVAQKVTAEMQAGLAAFARG
jgi:glutathione S-transferase